MAHQRYTAAKRTLPVDDDDDECEPQMHCYEIETDPPILKSQQSKGNINLLVCPCGL